MSHRKLIAVEAILIGTALAMLLGILFGGFASRSASAPVVGITVRGLAPTEPEPCEPVSGRQPLLETKILSYYGNPYAAGMGILGELPPAELADKLKAHAQRYNSLDGSPIIQPALHLVYATAQGKPGFEGLHLQYVDDKTLQRYIDLACENGFLIFLDLQIGRSDVEAEVRKILPYLEDPHVHVALDPEYAVAEGEVPRETLGSLDAADVNVAQALLEGYLEERDLLNKILVVHQFTEEMLTRPELIRDYPRVDLVINMDGIGPSDIKQVMYDRLTAAAEYAGIKLYFGLDRDHPMSEQEVLELEPDVIIYQ